MKVLSVPSSKGNVPVLLPSQMAEGSWVSNLLENIASGSYFGGGRMQAFREQQEKMIRAATDKIIKDAGGVPPPDVLGKKLIESLEAARAAMTAGAPGAATRSEAGAGVAELAQRVVGAPSVVTPRALSSAETAELVDSAKALLKQGGVMAPTAQGGPLNTLLNRVASKSFMVKNAATGELERVTAGMNPTEVQTALNQLNQLIEKSASDTTPLVQQQVAAARQLRTALASVLGAGAGAGRTVAESFMPKAVAAVRKAATSELPADIETWSAEDLAKLRAYAKYTPEEAKQLEDFFLNRAVRNPEDIMGGPGPIKSLDQMAEYAAQNSDKLKAALGDKAMNKLVAFRNKLAADDFDMVVNLVRENKAAPSQLVDKIASGNMPIETVRATLAKLPASVRQELEASTINRLFASPQEGTEFITSSALTKAKTALGDKLSALVSPQSLKAIENVQSALRLAEKKGTGTGRIAISLAQGRATGQSLAGS